VSDANYRICTTAGAAPSPSIGWPRALQPLPIGSRRRLTRPRRHRQARRVAQRRTDLPVGGGHLANPDSLSGAELFDYLQIQVIRYSLDFFCGYALDEQFSLPLLPD
jgi:hypothetical protein